MRTALIVALLLLPGFGAGAAAQAKPKPRPVPACVAKAGTRARVVRSKAECVAATEAYVEFVLSSELPHVVSVPASGTPAQNGQSLIDLLNLAPSVLIPNYPQIVVQLDAGVYAVPTGAVFPYGVSLQGAGMLSTFIEPGTGLSTQGTVSFTPCLDCGPEDGELSEQSLSDVTIIAPPVGQPAGLGVGQTFVMDHVRLEGISGAQTAPTLMALTTPQSHYMISNSLLGPFAVLPQGEFGHSADAIVNTISNTEVDFVGGYNVTQAPALDLCFGVYNASGYIYSSSCQ